MKSAVAKIGNLWKRTEDLGKDLRERNLEIARLESIPRYQPATTSLLGETLRFVDSASFLSAYRQIFEQDLYSFRAQGSNPLIIDCGANIGLAVIYWKRQYPASRIVAFEPDPNVFEALAWNCKQLTLDDVELHNKAVWNQVGELSFCPDGADAGHLAHQNLKPAESAIQVDTIRLRDYLNEEIDLLKLDIEGAEIEVLRDCEDLLHNVNHLFVEYHSFVGQEQHLDEIFSILKKSKFRIHIKSELVAANPFTDNFSYAGMDNSLNVFAYRS
jgi:FkbM family methyltransferase